MLDPPYRAVCLVCQRQWSARYTCTRCNARYCSLHCYKSHSERCTESLMRENVCEEMQADDETTRRTLEMLKRFHSEEEDDGRVLKEHMHGPLLLFVSPCVFASNSMS